MARVNCYLPDDLKAQIEALEPMVPFSQILRNGAVALLAEKRADQPVPPREPVGAS